MLADLTRALALALLSAAAQAQSADTVACLALCLTKPTDGACQLTPAAQTGRVQLHVDRYAWVPSCESRVVEAGSLLLRYRHRNDWFNPPMRIVAGIRLQDVLKAYPPDNCGVPGPNCVQARMSGKVGTKGGHGIDGQVSTPGGTGEPCLKGLPCGRILIPDSDWRFRLADPAFAGRWTLQVLRGAPPAGLPRSLVVDVQEGWVRLDGTQLAPGLSYEYRLTDAAGAAVASGEFSILARPLLAALHAARARREETGTPRGVAWIDTLATNDLEWDAHRLLVSGE